MAPARPGDRAPTRGDRLVWVAVAVAALFVVGKTCWSWLSTDPTIIVLIPEAGAQWIRFDRPFVRAARPETLVVTEFRKSFTLAEPQQQAVLTIRALEQADVLLNDRPIHAPSRRHANWKESLDVSLPGSLAAGEHTLRIVVRHQNGPALLLAYCETLELSTGPGWEARQAGRDWSPAVDVDRIERTELSRRFPVAGAARSSLPILAVVFFVVLAGMLAHERFYHIPRKFQRWTLHPGALRWWLMVAWCVLAANNLIKLPLRIGFDVVQHAEYIHFLLNERSLPLATDGWQMFQSPFYYVVCALLTPVFAAISDNETTWRLLRLVNLFCGVAQVELCYRCLRAVFPANHDVQRFGILLGGLLPMNVYISQYLGNEPLAALFSSAAIVLTICMICEPSKSRLPKNQYALGLCLGLALLTKVTPVVLIPPVLISLVVLHVSCGMLFGSVAMAIVRVLGTVAAVSGWYYLRNWYVLGKLFVGGWDPLRAIVWWQDPGYRTLQHFASFGESLLYPLYSWSVRCRFWDAFYSTMWLDGGLSSMLHEFRPPWNYDFMLTGSWLGLLPTAGILLGIVLAARQWWTTRPACVPRPKALVPAAVEEQRRVSGLKDQPEVDRSLNDTQSSLIADFSNESEAAEGGQHPRQPEYNAVAFAAVCILVYMAAQLSMYVHLPVYSTVKATYTLGGLPCYALLGAYGLEKLARPDFLRALVYAGFVCWALASYLAYFVV